MTSSNVSGNEAITGNLSVAGTTNLAATTISELTLTGSVTGTPLNGVYTNSTAVTNSKIWYGKDRATPILAPTLYDTTGNIKTVALAWQEWNCGPGEATIAGRVIVVKVDKSLAIGARNSSLDTQTRHLPQLIEMLIGSGATAEEGIRLMTQIANHFDLTLDQMREGARLLDGKTAKPDCDTLTAESKVTVGRFRQAIAWAQGKIHAAQQRQSVVANTV